MEANQEIKVTCEQGGDNVKDFEVNKSEVVLAEEIILEVDSSPSRKTEQLYKLHELQCSKFCPEEIWETILGKLKNVPDAQKNCANASPYFWELLKNDRVLFLFPTVLEIMAPKANTRKFGMFLETDNNEYEEEEHEFLDEDDRKEWKAAVLGCRLVCSAWNKGVEQCYQSATMAGIQELLPEGNMDPRSAVRRASSLTKSLFQLRCLSKTAEKFWEHFYKTHFSGISAPLKNPILGRQMSFTANSLEFFNKDIVKILEMCGKDIWYCHMKCCSHWSTQTIGVEYEYTRKFAEWLGFLRNVRFLKMNGPQVVEGLGKISFEGNLIPKLEKLEVLEFEETNGLIVSEMLRVNNHVKVVKMMDIQKSGVESEVGTSLTNLKDFSCGESGEKFFEKCGDCWKYVRRLELVNGSKYFGKLEMNWGKTLTELKLKDPFGKDKAKILRESLAMRLYLPGIRRLSLEIEGLFYLDFIRPMQGSLEHLEIIGNGFGKGGSWNRKRVKKIQSIELVGFEGKMQKSNVWKFFGKLETIKTSGGDDETEFLMFSKEGKKYLCISEEEEIEDIFMY